MFLKAQIAQRIHRLDDGRLVLVGRRNEHPYLLPSLAVGESVLKRESYEIYAVMAALFGAVNFGAFAFAGCIAVLIYLVWSRRRILAGLDRLDEKIPSEGGFARYLAHLPAWLPWVTLGLGSLPSLLFLIAMTPALLEGRREASGVFLLCVAPVLMSAAISGLLLFVRKWANHSLQARRP